MNSEMPLSQLKNGDISDIIYAEKKLHAAVKAEFSHYHKVYRYLHCNSNQSNHKSQIVISKYSSLDDLSIEISLKQLVLERDKLKSSVIVLPVFSQYILNHLSDNKAHLLQSSLKKMLQKIYLFQSQAKLLDLFLEWSLEKQQFSHVSKNETRQIIIPFLINEHYTIAVVNLSQKGYNKFAHIQFYNSYGKDLDAAYQMALKSFFKKHGFISKYDNISKRDQKDLHNCGVFVIFKAIEIACKNVGVEEMLLPCDSSDKQSYQQWAIRSRSQIANILHQQNINVLLNI